MRASLPALAAGLLMAGRAAAFEVSLPEPAVTITVPALPAIALRRQPPGAQAAALLEGGEGPYRVVLLTQASEGAAPATARLCAGRFLRALVARPGMPERDAIYRAPLDADTFLVLYARAEAPGPPQWHAHVVSAAGASHCLELHVQRARLPDEDPDLWRRTFLGAHVH